MRIIIEVNSSNWPTQGIVSPFYFTNVIPHGLNKLANAKLKTKALPPSSLQCICVELKEP